MFLNMMFCSYWGLIQWLQNHLLTCPFKKLTGFDCPGCGFQRSVIALLQGDILKSVELYPATIPIMLLAFSGLFERYIPKDKRPVINKSLYIGTMVVVAGSYLIKIGYLL